MNNLMKPPLQTAHQTKKQLSSIFTNPKTLIKDEPIDLNILRSNSLKKFDEQKNN